MKFRKKPMVIEAIKHRGQETWGEVYAFLHDGNMQKYAIRPDETLRIVTREGVMTADVGDWIIKGVKGELYPVKDEIFKETYELVGD